MIFYDQKDAGVLRVKAASLEQGRTGYTLED